MIDILKVVILTFHYLNIQMHCLQISPITDLILSKHSPLLEFIDQFRQGFLT
jgi:hypothetical protein